MKKLLAVVLSAAMVLGMSTMAFADEGNEVAYPTTLSLSKSEDGMTVYVNADAEKWNSLERSVITYPADAVVVEEGKDFGVVTAAFKAGVSGDIMPNNENAGIRIFAGAYTGKDSSGNEILLEYNGPIYYITFASEGVEVSLVKENEDGTTEPIASVTTGVASDETPAPGGDETPAPADETPAPADETPAPADETEPPKGTATPTPAPGTGSTGSKTTTTTTTSKTASTTTAAKTADAAPVAVMAVLALAAAVVVVGMKKKVTE